MWMTYRTNDKIVKIRNYLLLFLFLLKIKLKMNLKEVIYIKIISWTSNGMENNYNEKCISIKINN